jgi:putative methionine-R-sulfoxide reductase with GAF domain
MNETTPFDEETPAVQASRYRQINRDIARVLSQCTNVEAAIPRILHAICEGLGWDYGIYWQPDEAAQNLHCAETWIAPSMDLEEFDADTRGRTFHVGEGVLGKAWEGGEPVWVSDIQEEPGFLRPEIAARAGLESAVYVPVPTGHAEERDALIEFLLSNTTEPDHEMIEMLHTVSIFVYQYLRLRAAEDHLRTLRGLDLNDNVVQGLAVARLALESGDTTLAMASIDAALEQAKRVINELVAGADTFRREERSPD